MKHENCVNKDQWAYQTQKILHRIKSRLRGKLVMLQVPFNMFQSFAKPVDIFWVIQRVGTILPPEKSHSFSESLDTFTMTSQASLLLMMVSMLR